MKTQIWSKPTRIFHWLLVIGMLGAYILGESEGLLNIHTALGYMVAILLLFRIIWGFIGPKYSRFSDFTLGLKKLKAFYTNIREAKKHYPGHNPAASWIMAGIIAAGIFVTISGMLILASKGQGFFASFNISGNPHSYEEMHEVGVNILLVLVVIHLLGLLIDKIFNSDYGTLLSMFTGKKNLEGVNVRLTTFQQSFSWILMLLAIAAFAFTVSFQKIEERHRHGDQRQNEIRIEHDRDD